MPLGGAECGLEARLVNGAVQRHRGGSRAGKRPKREGREVLGGRDVETALQRKHVALEPAQQVEATTETGIRELRQMGVQVDEPGQEQPRPEVHDGIGEARGRGGPGSQAFHGSDPAAGIDDEHAVGQEPRLARVEAA